MAEKSLKTKAVEFVESAVDTANRMTREFLESTKILPQAEAKEPESAKDTAMGARRDQGAGFYQGRVE